MRTMERAISYLACRPKDVSHCFDFCMARLDQKQHIPSHLISSHRISTLEHLRIFRIFMKEHTFISNGSAPAAAEIYVKSNEAPASSVIRTVSTGADSVTLLLGISNQ